MCLPFLPGLVRRVFSCFVAPFRYAGHLLFCVGWVWYFLPCLLGVGTVSQAKKTNTIPKSDKRKQTPYQNGATKQANTIPTPSTDVSDHHTKTEQQNKQTPYQTKGQSQQTHIESTQKEASRSHIKTKQQNKHTP